MYYSDGYVLPEYRQQMTVPLVVSQEVPRVVNQKVPGVASQEVPRVVRKEKEREDD
jgi:hypothetical protein